MNGYLFIGLKWVFNVIEVGMQNQFIVKIVTVI